MSTETDSVDVVVSDRDDDVVESPRQGRNPLVIAGVVLVVIAAIAAAVFGVLWFNAAHSDSAAYSKMRDDALRAAEQGSINLTSLDYRHVKDGLNRWKQSTTGTLYQQLNSGNLATTFTKQAEQAKSVTTGKVLDGVITDLDDHAGKASALIYMQVTVSAKGSKPTEKLVPLQWDLQLVNGVWKLSGIPSSSTSSGQ